MNIFEQYRKRRSNIDKQLYDNKVTSENYALKALQKDREALFSDWCRIGNDFPIRK